MRRLPRPPDPGADSQYPDGLADDGHSTADPDPCSPLAAQENDPLLCLLPGRFRDHLQYHVEILQLVTAVRLAMGGLVRPRGGDRRHSRQHSPDMDAGAPPLQSPFVLAGL